MVESGPYVEYCCELYVRHNYVVSLVVLGLSAVALSLFLWCLIKNHLLPRLRSRARQRPEKCPVESNSRN